MKIVAIDITRHRIALDPPPVPVSWDSRPRGSFAITLVRVRTDQGLEGVAAGDTMGGFAEHADLFLGHDPRDIERHHAVLDNLCFHYGRCLRTGHVGMTGATAAAMIRAPVHDRRGVAGDR